MNVELNLAPRRFAIECLQAWQIVKHRRQFIFDERVKLSWENAGENDHRRLNASFPKLNGCFEGRDAEGISTGPNECLRDLCRAMAIAVGFHHAENFDAGSHL